MITVVACYVLLSSVCSLCVWALLAARAHGRQEADRARAEFARDAGNLLLSMATAKDTDGDHVTAAALRSVGAYIVADIYEIPSEALRNETRLKARKEETWERQQHSQ